MKHTGKIAPPAIMFLTDGGPTDDYESDLEELLKNGWFANASRSAVLLGDAINDDDANNAVRRFVEDPDNDIVDAENSTVIIQKIKIATMHTVAGDPMDKGNVGGGNTSPIDTTASGKNDAPSGTDTSTAGTGSTGGDDPFKVEPNDPFGGNTDGDDPFSGNTGGSDPFGGNTDGDDPFSGNTGGSDPFGGNTDGDDTFSGSTSGDDPFGGNTGGSNPFGGGTDGDDSLGGGTCGDDPFGGSDGNNPFGGMM